MLDFLQEMQGGMLSLIEKKLVKKITSHSVSFLLPDERILKTHF